MRCFATEFHPLPALEGQIRSVPGAALALTVATLAVVHRHRFTGDFVTDRAAGASAGIDLTHVCSPSIKRCWANPRAPSCRKTYEPRKRSHAAPRGSRALAAAVVDSFSAPRSS